MYPMPYRSPYGYIMTDPVPNAYIRLLHASPNAPAVDVYANDSLIARNLTYKQFTEYMSVPAGNYRIKVYPAGQTANPVISTDLVIKSQTISTVAAIGTLPSIRLLPILDTMITPTPAKAYIRFIHLSPNAPNVDVVLSNGIALFTNVEYTGVTHYIPVNPGTYTFEVRPAGTNNTVLYVPNIVLNGNKNYSIYAVGLVGGFPPLEVLIPLDGSTYIRF